jgi:hypothetical protein
MLADVNVGNEYKQEGNTLWVEMYYGENVLSW